MAGITLRFPSAQAFAPARAIVASVETLLGGLNGRWAVRYDFPTSYRTAPRTLTPRKGAPPRQETVAEVITHFIRSRDMFEMTDSALQAIGQEIVTRAIADVRAGGTVPSASTLMLRIANAQKQLVIRRWEAGGGDLALAPLSPEYESYKRRLGYPTRIGTLTGQSLAALKRVRVVAVRVGA